MALTSSSTLADAQAQYRDNMRYKFSDSVTMCADFIEACTFILEAKPTRQQLEAVNLFIDLGVIERRLEAAEAWYDTHPDAAGAAMGTTYGDLSGGQQ